MPIFNMQLKKIDTNDTKMALKAMENHIRYIQEQLEYTLTNLDSSNVTEIETDKTNITSSDGSVNITKDSIALSGKNGEAFTAGYNTKTGMFQFEVKGKNGAQTLYMNSNGELVITKNTTLSIDGGSW